MDDHRPRLALCQPVVQTTQPVSGWCCSTNDPHIPYDHDAAAAAAASASAAAASASALDAVSAVAALTVAMA